jgi:hypothetical protein
VNSNFDIQLLLIMSSSILQQEYCFIGTTMQST